jgi:hypothetical protein
MKGRKEMEDWPFEIEPNKKPGFWEWVKGIAFGVLLTFSIYYFIFSNALKIRMGVK